MLLTSCLRFQTQCPNIVLVILLLDCHAGWVLLACNYMIMTDPTHVHLQHHAASTCGVCNTHLNSATDIAVPDRLTAAPSPSASSITIADNEPHPGDVSRYAVRNQAGALPERPRTTSAPRTL